MKIERRISILISSLIFILLFCSNLFILTKLGYWSDGALSKNIANNLLKGGFLTEDNPGGWLEFFLTPTSLRNPIDHPPTFSYLLVLLNFLDGKLIVLSLFYALVTLFSIFLLLSLFLQKRTKIFYLSFVFLSFIPLMLWNSAHIFVEPLIYFITITALYFIIIKKNYILSSIFISFLFILKVSTIPIILFLLVTIFLSIYHKKWRFKELMMLIIILSLITLPFIIFSLNYKGTISYAPPGLPVLDKYIFKPYWSLEKHSWEKEIYDITNSSNLEKVILNLESFNKPLLLRLNNLKNFPQYFYPLGIINLNNQSLINWYSPNFMLMGGLCLVIFLVGLVILLFKQKLELNQKIILISSLFLLLIFYQTGELRHGFLLSLIFGALITLIFLRHFSFHLNKKVFILFAFSFMIILSVSYASEISHLEDYQYQYLHNPTSITDSITILKNISLNPNYDVIFCQDKNDIPLITGKRCIWDSRIFLLNRELVEKYFGCYNAKNVIILRKFLSDKSLNNDLSNLDRIEVYTNSDFYLFLEDTNFFEKKQIGGFDVYEYKKEPICG